MSNNYTIVIEKVGDYTDTMVDCKEMGYVATKLAWNYNESKHPMVINMLHEL